MDFVDGADCADVPVGNRVRRRSTENIPGVIAFFALIAGQFAAVVTVNRIRLGDENAEQPERRPEMKADPHTRHLWLST